MHWEEKDRVDKLVKENLRTEDTLRAWNSCQLFQAVTSESHEERSTLSPWGPSLPYPTLPELEDCHKALTPGPGCLWHPVIIATALGSSQCFLVSSCPYSHPSQCPFPAALHPACGQKGIRPFGIKGQRAEYGIAQGAPKSRWWHPQIHGCLFLTPVGVCLSCLSARRAV